jgi:DNA-binding MarR family transcriptional regulator
MHVNALAHSLEVSQQAASKAARSLEDRDYVQCVPSPSDRRLHDVWLTPQGWALLTTAKRWASDHQSQGIDRWGRNEVRAATAILTDFAATSAHFSGAGRNQRASLQ